MNCSRPGFSVHGISQARSWSGLPFSFSRGSSQPRDWTRVSCSASRFFTAEPLGKPLVSRTQFKREREDFKTSLWTPDEFSFVTAVCSLDWFRNLLVISSWTDLDYSEWREALEALRMVSCATRVTNHGLKQLGRIFTCLVMLEPHLPTFTYQIFGFRSNLWSLVVW